MFNLPPFYLIEAEVIAIASDPKFSDVVYKVQYHGGDVDAVGCRYEATPANPTGCMIGFALRRLQSRFPDKDYSNLDGEGSACSAYPQTSTPFLREVQTMQDQGRASWSECVVKSLHLHNLVPTPTPNTKG